MNKNTKFIEALSKFADAAAMLNIAWENNHELGTEAYPFGKSFDEMSDSIVAWYDVQQEIIDTPYYKVLAEKYANHQPENFGWIDENTGGGCMVFYKEYIGTNGKPCTMSLTDESFGLLDVPYDLYNSAEYFDHEDDSDHIITSGNLCDYRGEDECRAIFNELTGALSADQINDVFAGYGMYCARYRD